MVVKAGIVTGDTLCEPSLASWFLAIKSEGNKATFSHWPRLDTCLQPRHGFCCKAYPETKASKKAVLEVRCSRSVFFIGSKGAL